MSTQTEALRLAAALDAYWGAENGHDRERQAAAELRRLVAENERLAAEVANRNRRALAGDEAVAALANVHAHYECLEAQRDALLEACKVALGIVWFGKEYDQIAAAIKAVEEQK